jgi:hypothetical protein
MRTVRRLFSAAALALVLQPSQAESQGQTRLEFRESGVAVQVLYDGRMIRSYDGATGELIREFRSADPRRGSLLLLKIRTGGNACMPEMAVMDVGRTPAYASDVFGDCHPDILVGNRDHLALSVRSDGGRPDDVWYYDGRSVKQLARLTRDEYIRRGEAARAAGNLPEAVRYFLAVADHGDARGPLALGEMARSGEGIERDAPLARDLLTRAAEMGQLKAMVALASMLRGGEGGEPDKAAALRWLQLAASRGDGFGQLQLAELLEAGEDAPKDEEAAFVWYRLAESALVGTPGAVAARTAAERVSQRLGDERAASTAQRVAVFRPLPPGPIWDLPADWSVWERRHPLQRVRGTTLFEMPAFSAPVRAILGPHLYGRLAELSGPAETQLAGDWLVVSGCKAHDCESQGYIISLRRDGTDAAACVKESGPPRAGTAQPVRTLTFARTGAPRRQQEATTWQQQGCPETNEQLLAMTQRPPTSLGMDRDRPHPAPVAVPAPPILPAPAPRPRVAGPVPASGQRIGTGSAWRFSEGTYVTDFHVVEACGVVRLANGPQARSATLIGRDEETDLAVLRSELTTENSLALRESAPRAAEPVLVAGFPLQSLLASGPQVSTGIVTALAGIRDDASRIQISAPIQPGNSGGPVLDREGRVLGVAASTLGTLETTIATGTVPQNVNFAIRADRVASLLRRLDIRVDSASPASPMTTEEVASRALTSVVLVECLK